MMQTDHGATAPEATRRRLLGAGLGLGGAGMLPAGAVPAQAQAQAPGAAPAPAAPRAGLLTRNIPRTQDSVPAIGLGTFLTFDLIPGAPRGHLQEVMRTYWDGGARVVDTSPLYGMGEVNAGAFATALDINGRMFLTNKLWSTGEFLADDSHARRSLETSLARSWRSQIDVLQCHNLVNIDIALPLMAAWKREGLVRFTGATHHDYAYFPVLAALAERGAVDFIQLRYSIFSRQAEERVLPAAAAQGIGVLVAMPLEKARLTKLVEGRPLPDFAPEIGVRSWAQYFLKWVISHPAVTCALPATANPAHAAENVAAMQGPMPDRDMRARMLRHMEGIPGFDAVERMPWYPDKRYPGVIARAQSGLRARSG
ncbi:aldo/keto reductase [Siccirubricoccus phaeus]|uniref:aldo/keto reductase n=1 Tax=Siccirubricoccus phaeus TaxID=2595053 RepID=UPI001F3D73B9|nr:aldo/keto reductase [Siccirubricoccus phaeus]